MQQMDFKKLEVLKTKELSELTGRRSENKGSGKD